MSFTTWVRAQDAHGQFDVRKGDELREGVTLVKDYPEHISMTGRAGKPFVNLGTAVADGYAGLKKQDLIDEINRRNESAVIGPELIEIPNKPSIRTLTDLLTADDKARQTAAAAALEAGGIAPAELQESELKQLDDTTSGPHGPGTGEDINTTDAGHSGGESE